MVRDRLPPETWDAVMRRDRWCQATAYGWDTGTPCQGRLTVHHRLPRGMGGRRDAHRLDVLVVLCDGHHREVESLRSKAYGCGLLIRGGGLPADRSLLESDG